VLWWNTISEDLPVSIFWVVSYCKTIWHHNPEDLDLDLHSHENQKSLGLLADKKPVKQFCVLKEENVDKLGPRLAFASQQSPRCFKQETNISKSSVRNLTKLLLH
jgi:hypothetical protein